MVIFGVHDSVRSKNFRCLKLLGMNKLSILDREETSLIENEEERKRILQDKKRINYMVAYKAVKEAEEDAREIIGEARKFRC